MSPVHSGHTPLTSLRSFAPLSLCERGGPPPNRSGIAVRAMGAVHVVTVGFPEAKGVGVNEADAAEPLGGFPEVEMGNGT